MVAALRHCTAINNLRSAAATRDRCRVFASASCTLSYANLSSRTPTMIRISPVTLANTKPDAALGGAPGSRLPAQIKSNNQHTKLDKAMPVRGTPQ